MLVVVMVFTGLTPAQALAAPAGGDPLSSVASSVASSAGSRLASWLDGVGRWIAGLHEEPRSGMRAGPAWSPPGRSGTPPATAQPKPPGRRVRELTGERTATRTVYRLDDGRTQAELSSRPVRYRDGSGRWRDVETTVRGSSVAGFPFGNDGTGFATRFGDRTDRLVRVQLGGRSVTVGVAGAARRVTPKVSGSTVTYPGVWDGADLVYEVTAGGVKEFIALSRPPAPGASFQFTVRARGLAARTAADGSIGFFASGGSAPVFALPKPFMTDARQDAASPYGHPYSDRVELRATRRGGETTVTVRPDGGWLAAAERVYPVKIDPTIKVQPDRSASRDAMIQENAPDTNFGQDWQLAAGVNFAGPTRALVAFDLAGVVPSGTRIEAAELGLYYDHTLYLGGNAPVRVPLEARRVTAAWQEGTATWLTASAAMGEVVASSALEVNQVHTWHRYAVRDLVQRWLDGTVPNHGIMVKAVDESEAIIGGPVYQSAEQFDGTGTQAPKLTLTFGAPSVDLDVPQTVHATGAELSWRPYVDPSPAEGDNLVEYQVHRSYQPNFVPTSATLVAPLPAGTTSYTDTTAQPADAGAAQGRPVFYSVVVVRKDGQRVASTEARAALPRVGYATRVIQAQTLVADTTLSACQPTVGHDAVEGRTELVTGIQNVGRNINYGKTRTLAKFDTSAIPQTATVTDAQLGLWRVQDNGNSTSMTLHPLTRGFDESATWNKATASSSWTTAGGDFGPTIGTTILKSDPLPGWARFPATGTVQGWVMSPASNNGFLVRMASEPTKSCQANGEGAIWTSSENAEPGLRPYLQVTYTDRSLTYYAGDTPSRLRAGETVSVPVTVTNTTATLWRATSTRLGYWWKRPDGTDATTPASQALTALPADLAPGQTVTVNATVTAPAPSTAGNKAEAYTLAWDTYDSATNNWQSSSHLLPQLPQQIGVEDPTSDLLGTEAFYSYTSKATGAGSEINVNNYAGNVVWSYDAYNHPSRGPDTSVAMTYNSLDTSRSSMGFGWSLQASTLQRLGSRLTFSPPGQTWPSQVRLVDSDGTTSVFVLDDHGVGVGACTPATCDYVHPRGVHLYLQRTGSADPTRTWVFTAPDRTQFFFDNLGYQSAVVDGNGNTMSFVYELRRSNNVPTKFLQYVVDALGRHTLELDWWTKGENYTFITDTGSEASGTNLTNPFIIDQLQSITDVAGRKITFTYTVEGLMAKMVDGAGDPKAKTFRFAYDATQGNRNVKLLTATDPRAHATRLSYYTAPVDPQNLWKLHEFTDRIGGVTHFDYVDPDGPTEARIHATVRDPEQHSTRYELDRFGRPERTTDAKNQTTIYGFDDDHNLTRLEEPPPFSGAERPVTEWEYNTATGYPLTFTTAEANANGWPATGYLYLTTLNGHVADLVFKDSPERRVWFYTYDTRGNLTSATDPAGSASPEEGDFTTRFEYDEFGQLIRMVDANGNATVLSDHDATGQPRTSTDADGNATRFSYDMRGNVLTITDPLTHSRSWSYDLFKRLTTSTEQKDAAAGDLIVTPGPTYDANDNVTEYAKANSAAYTYAYDDDDRVTSILEPRDDEAGAPERRTSFGYDKVGNRLTVTEPNGNLTSTAGDYTTTYGYDEIYQLTSVRDAAGKVTSYRYDGAGNLTTVVDPRKNATPDPADYTASYVYTRDHQVAAVVDALGFSTSFGYDRDGLRTTVTDQNRSVSTTKYDPRGKVIETRVPHEVVDGQVRENITRFEYDQAGNQTKVISPRGVQTEDDPRDFLTEFRYDKLNRPIEQVYPFDEQDPEPRNRVPRTVEYRYDAASRLTSVALPAGDPAFTDPPSTDTDRIVSTTEYFDNGWIKKSTDPLGIAVSYDYNDAGEQTERTVRGADGAWQRALTWDYFPDGKLRHHATVGESTIPPFPDIRAFNFTYDANGNLKTVTDNDLNPQIDRWEIGYDQRNQIETIVEKLRGEAKNTGTYRYNENGAPDRFEHDGAISEFTYDERDLLSSVRNATNSGDPAPRFTTYTYTPRAERATETKSNRNIATYEYFLDGLLRHSVERKAGGALVAEHNLQYQANSRLSRDELKLEVGEQPGLFVQRTRGYSYDARDRVSKVEEPNNPAQSPERYSYDANSNVIIQTIGSDTTHFLYNRNRLVHAGSAINPRSTTYNYDGSGRVRSVSGGPTEFERYFYDGFDRIVEHDQLGADEVMREARYAYDAFGRTSATTLTDQAGSKTTVYSYLGLTGEVLDEETGGVPTRSFEYSAWNERLAQARLGTDRPGRAIYGYNSHGDVETLGGENGDTLATHGYSAYGVALSELTSGVDKIHPGDPYKEPYNPYWFHARRFDQIAFQPVGTQDHQPASYHMGQRDYQPASHRFLSPDARNGARSDLGLNLSPATTNRYGFAGGTPASNVQYVGPIDWERELKSLAVGIAVGLAVTLLAGPVCGATAGAGCVAAFWFAAGALGAAASYGVNVGLDPKRSFNAGEFALETTLGGVMGLLSFGLAKGVSGGSARALSCNSFAPGTAVVMEDGSRKPIEVVKVGDKVLAGDPKTGRAQGRPVTARIVGSGEKHLVEVTVDTDGSGGSRTGKVVATDEHPFWVASLRAWRGAKDLRPGDLLRTSAGTYVQVVKTRSWTAHQRVYNLTVDADHTFYVGASTSSLLVHNASPCDLFTRAKALYGLRRGWKSTVGVAEVLEVQTGRRQLWVATERAGLPKEWDPLRGGTNPLRAGVEQYIYGPGHAETTILDALNGKFAGQYEILSIATSTRICYPCLHALKQAGLTPIGVRGRSTMGYSPWRMMVRTAPIFSG